MKKTINLAASLMAAITVASVAVPARAADQTTTSSDQSDKSKRIGEAQRADKLIGKQVRSSDNQKLGKIDDAVFDLESGRILYAIVGSGGVLGAGEKKFAIAPGLFTETRGNDVHLNVDKEKFNGAPEYTKDIDKVAERNKAAFVHKVYQYFGQNFWWQGTTAPDAGTFNNVHKASEIDGTKVMNSSNQDMAKVDTVILDLPAGRVVYVILSPDRSLDLGNNLYALPPNALTLGSDQKSLVSGDLSKEKFASAPHFTKDNWPDFASTSWASQVYQYYGKQPYFDTSGSLQPTSEREKERVYPQKK